MKLTIRLKLLTTSEQAGILHKTIVRFNEACNELSKIAHEKNITSHVLLHKQAYYHIRASFGLSAQMAVRAIGKVAQTYKGDTRKIHRFKADGALVLDSRLLTYRDRYRVSVSTLDGRLVIPFTCRQDAEDRLAMIKGQADLVYRDGMFFLLQTVALPDPCVHIPEDYLGVDLGIINLAADSDGQRLSGKKVNGLRRRHARLRSRLQKKGTTSARRLLKRRKRKEQRFARDVNHCISKKLVHKAQGTARGIALEDLKGIRERTTVRKSQRRRHVSWSFFQLRSFIEYKSSLAGVHVVVVDPSYTSQRCPCCGCVDKGNRRSQSSFVCISCGFAGHADTVAAENIRRGAINLPNVAGVSCAERQTQQLAAG